MVTLDDLTTKYGANKLTEVFDSLGLEPKDSYEDDDSDLAKLRDYKPESVTESAQAPTRKEGRIRKPKSKGGDLGSGQQKTSLTAEGKAKDAGIKLAKKAGEVKLQAFLETTVACEEEFAKTIEQVYDRMEVISAEAFDSDDNARELEVDPGFLGRMQATLNSYF